MAHHQTDELRTGEEIAEEYFLSVLTEQLSGVVDADKIAELSALMAYGLRGNSISIVPVQNGHFTRTLELLEGHIGTLNKEISALKSSLAHSAKPRAPKAATGKR